MSKAISWEERGDLRELLSYPRGVLNYVLGVLWTMLVCSLVFPTGILGFRKLSDSIVKLWAKGLLKMSNVEVELEGMENIPDGGALFVFNHSSHFDIPVVMASFKKSHRWGAKAELFKIPLFGLALRGHNCFPIFRNKREKVLELYQSLITDMEKGDWIILAPEGTRRCGKELGPFKAGPFIMAVNGGFDIVPIVMAGNHKILPKGKLLPGAGQWKHKVHLQVLPPISVEGYNLENRSALQALTRDKMAKAYTEGLQQIEQGRP